MADEVRSRSTAAEALASYLWHAWILSRAHVKGISIWTGLADVSCHRQQESPPRVVELTTISERGETWGHARAQRGPTSGPVGWTCMADDNHRHISREETRTIDRPSLSPESRRLNEKQQQLQSRSLNLSKDLCKSRERVTDFTITANMFV